VDSNFRCPLHREPGFDALNVFFLIPTIEDSGAHRHWVCYQDGSNTRGERGS
jgi:hypothetical protein